MTTGIAQSAPLFPIVESTTSNPCHTMTCQLARFDTQDLAAPVDAEHVIRWLKELTLVCIAQPSKRVGCLQATCALTGIGAAALCVLECVAQHREGQLSHAKSNARLPVESVRGFPGKRTAAGFHGLNIVRKPNFGQNIF